MNKSRRFKWLIAGLALVSTVLSANPPAAAQDAHPVFVAPGFRFDQVESICVMPLIDGRNGVPPINLEPERLALIYDMQEKGYRVVDPSCSNASGASATEVAKARWVLTARLDDFEISKTAPNLVLGSYLTVSLFDTQSAKEVWRDTAKTGRGGRFAAALVGSNLEDAIESSYPPLLSKFEKQKKPYPPSPATTWKPMSYPGHLYRSNGFRGCNGQVTFDSGILSFEPSSNGKDDKRCEKFRFSARGVKSNLHLWVVPKNGRFVLQQYGGSLQLLDLSLRSAY